jgi:hypothetical protein
LLIRRRLAAARPAAAANEQHSSSKAHAGDGAGFLFGSRHGYAFAAVTLTP